MSAVRSTSNVAARVSFTERRQRQLLLRHVLPSAVAVCRRARPGHAEVLASWSPAASRTPRYRENDGINRVNQQLIDNGTYLTGGVVGGPANISGFGTEIDLTGTTQLNPRIIIDEPTGTGAHSLHVKAQIIQTFKATR